MLRALVFGVVALIATVATVAAYAPAQWLTGAVRNASQGHVDLADASGTIWSGQAIVVISGGVQQGAPRSSLAEPLTWKLSPWSLLAGVVDLTLSHPTALAQPLAISVTFNRRVDAGPATVRLPASLLATLGAPWNTIRPGGVISFTWDRLTINAGRVQGNLSAEWQFASSALTPVSPFGHYRLQSNGSYPGLQLMLLTVSGPLEMIGNGTIAEGGRLRFQGVARAVPGADPAIKLQLAGLIALLGRREGETAILNFGS
jgi:general secretion pathway protein N